MVLSRALIIFKEADFPAVDMTNQWGFFPTMVGTWGISSLYHVSIPPLRST